MFGESDWGDRLYVNSVGSILFVCRVTLLTLNLRLLTRRIGFNFELIMLTCLYWNWWVLYTLANCSLLECGMIMMVWVMDLVKRNAKVLMLLGI